MLISIILIFSIHILRLLLGATQLNFGDSLSTLPASVELFYDIFSGKDFTYQFDSYSTLIFPINETQEKESNIHYSFSLKLIPYNSEKPGSPTSLLLPYTTLQSESFNKIASTSVASNAQPDRVNDAELINSDGINEKHTEDTAMGIPKTFAYTLSLLDCSFNKRPFPGIWQLR